MKKIFLVLALSLLIAIPVYAGSSRWVVTWMVRHMEIVPCASEETPYCDEYGRCGGMLSNYTLEICYKDQEIPQIKYFDSYEEAETFVRQGENTANDDFMDVLHGFEIREVKQAQRGW